MNNISLWEILYPQKLRTNRIDKIMKITLTLVFVSIFSMFAGNIHSQNARITFTKNNATLESVLNEIENQTDYLFIINSNIDTHQKVSKRHCLSSRRPCLPRNRAVRPAGRRTRPGARLFAGGAAGNIPWA